MQETILKIHPKDNVLVALRDLPKGQTVEYGGLSYLIAEDIPAKHKFTMSPLEQGDAVVMYGVLVGKAKQPIPVGSRISTSNLQHAADEYKLSSRRKTGWHIPEINKWKEKTFMGYKRSDGSVGTANYWLIVPLVFCENRNVDVLKDALLEELGYARPKKYKRFTKQLVEMYREGKPVSEIVNANFSDDAGSTDAKKLFDQVDGIKFISHDGGCGGT